MRSVNIEHSGSASPRNEAFRGARSSEDGRCLLTALLLVGVLAVTPLQAETTEELSLAFSAKILCSGVFVSGLNADDVMVHSVNPAMLFEELQPADIAETEVDREAKSVRLVSRSGMSAVADFRRGLGCVIRSGKESLPRRPTERTSGAADRPRALPWPSTRLTDAAMNERRAEALQRAVAAAFEPDALTAAFVIVHEGKVVVEEYANGAARDTRLASWSMGKSLIVTLLGVLVQQGAELDIYRPAPVPAWNDSNDPRRTIRIIDLLRMSSGLDFSGLRDPRERWTKAHPDHLYVYSGAIDVFAYAVGRPLEYTPGTVGRYRNCDPLVVGYLIKRVVEERGQEYLRFPFDDLLEKIGAQTILPETDPYGNYIMTGYVYGAALDWARIGQLYLQDGTWDGRRLLPADWIELVSSAAPAWEREEYGALFWLNRDGRWNLPKDTFYMAGGGGQFTFVVPSLDLVVVRMGHYKGGMANDDTGMALAPRALNEALSQVTAAVAD